MAALNSWTIEIFNRTAKSEIKYLIEKIPETIANYFSLVSYFLNPLAKETLFLQPMNKVL